MPDTRAWDVTVTAGYEIGSENAFEAALKVIEALGADKPYPVTLKVEVSENA